MLVSARSLSPPIMAAAIVAGRAPGKVTGWVAGIAVQCMAPPGRA